MLKLGTVFSGIGAIEHALKRLGIDYKVTFACDNGGVDIFSKKIDNNLLKIEREINSLHQRIMAINHEHCNDDNAISFMKHLQHIIDLYQQLKDFSQYLGEEINCNMILLNTLANMFTNSNQLKGMNKLPWLAGEFASLESTQIYHYFYLARDLNNHFNKYKNNEELVAMEANLNVALNQYIECYNELVERTGAKKLNSIIKEITDSINMLNERMTTVEILDELTTIDSYEEKKKYVDNLYSGKDKSNFVMQSYKENYEIEDQHFHWNASFLDGTQYYGEVDLIVGGSPCQSFSLVGKRRGLQDTRGTLFYEFARLISEIQPKVFIYENVKGLLDHDNGNTWATMKQVFSDLNYVWYDDVLNAKNYGMPQNRERLFVVGFRNDLVLKKEFDFPKPVKLDKVMKDFLLDKVLGKYYLNKKGVDFVTKEKNLVKRYTQIDGEIQLCQKANQQFNWHGDFVYVEENRDKEKTIEDLEKYFLSEKVRKYVMASGTKGFYSKPIIDLDIARPLLTTMHKMHRAGVDNYVTTEGRIRKLTPRECLRLMGFCDSFKIVVSDTQLYQQAGNSIVVDVIMAIVESIKVSMPHIIDGDGYQYREYIESNNDADKETIERRNEQLSFL